MATLNILEWNINQRSSDTKNQDFLADEILDKNPDVVILVEFKGDANVQILENKLTEHYIYSYNGTPYDASKPNKTGNGVFVALNKSRFFNPTLENMIQERSTQKIEKENPNFLAIRAQLLSGKYITLVGMRIRIGGKNEVITERKEQLEYILESFKDDENIIIVGDFNNGPHWEKESAWNWEKIKKLISSKNFSTPYSPKGTSWKYATLDWIITKGVSVDKESSYNILHWDFARHYEKEYFVDGYQVPEGYFIRNTPTYPDHAILTVEVKL